MILEVSWAGLWTLSFGLSQFQGHGSWLMCEVALRLHNVLDPQFDKINYKHNYAGVKVNEMYWESPSGPEADLGEPTHTLVPWRQGFRHPTRNQCTGWFTPAPGGSSNLEDVERDAKFRFPPINFFTDILTILHAILISTFKELT
jgi:hypothetical protein